MLKLKARGAAKFLDEDAVRKGRKPRSAPLLRETHKKPKWKLPKHNEQAEILWQTTQTSCLNITPYHQSNVEEVHWRFRFTLLPLVLPSAFFVVVFLECYKTVSQNCVSVEGHGPSRRTMTHQKKTSRNDNRTKFYWTAMKKSENSSLKKAHLKNWESGLLERIWLKCQQRGEGLSLKTMGKIW